MAKKKNKWSLAALLAESESESEEENQDFTCAYCEQEFDSAQGCSAHMKCCKAYKEFKLKEVLEFLGVLPLLFYLVVVSIMGTESDEKTVAEVLYIISTCKVTDAPVKALKENVHDTAEKHRAALKTMIKSLSLQLTAVSDRDEDGGAVKKSEGKGKAKETFQMTCGDGPGPSQDNARGDNDNESNDEDDFYNEGDFYPMTQADSAKDDPFCSPPPCQLPMPSASMLAAASSSSLSSSSGGAKVLARHPSYRAGPSTPIRNLTKKKQRSPGHNQANDSDPLVPQGKLRQKQTSTPAPAPAPAPTPSAASNEGGLCDDDVTTALETLEGGRAPLNPYVFVGFIHGLYFLTGRSGAPPHHTRASELKQKYQEYTEPLLDDEFNNGKFDSWMCACGTLNMWSKVTKGCSGTHCWMRHVPVVWRLKNLSNAMTYKQQFELCQQVFPSDRKPFSMWGRQLIPKFSNRDSLEVFRHQKETNKLYKCNVCQRRYWDPSICLCQWTPHMASKFDCETYAQPCSHATHGCGCAAQAGRQAGVCVHMCMGIQYTRER